jgi:hypothetical protein
MRHCPVQFRCKCYCQAQFQMQITHFASVFARDASSQI